MERIKLRHGEYCTSLNLPCGFLQFEDALQRLHVCSEEALDGLEFDGCSVTELFLLKLDHPTLDELNCLAQRLEQFSDNEILAYRALLSDMDCQTPVSMKTLINLTANLNTVPVLPLASESILGEVVISHGNLSLCLDGINWANISDKELALMDTAKIGQAMSDYENGIFLDNQWYVPRSKYRMEEIYDGVTLPSDYLRTPGAAAITIHPYQSDSKRILFPLEDKSKDSFDRFDEHWIINEGDFILPMPDCYEASIIELESMSERVAALTPEDRLKLKAVVTMEFPLKLSIVNQIIDRLDDYDFDPACFDRSTYIGNMLDNAFEAAAMPSWVREGFAEYCESTLCQQGSIHFTEYGATAPRGTMLYEAEETELSCGAPQL